jgi:hypothetical protein
MLASQEYRTLDFGGYENILKKIQKSVKNCSRAEILNTNGTI